MPLSRIQSYSNSLSDDTRWNVFLPAAPTGLTVSAINAQATLSWNAPTVATQTPITDYTVQYSTNSGSSWTTFARSASTSTTVSVTGLTNGQAYVLRVAAINGIGAGVYSTASSTVTPTVFSPSTVSNLHLWLDASDATTLYNATSGGSLVSADGTVARWEDKSGNARHATQATAGSRPILKINSSGQRVVRFDGISTFLATSTTFSDDSDFSIFFTTNQGLGRGIDGFGSGWSISFPGGVVAGGVYVPSPASQQTRGISSMIWRNGVSISALSNGTMTYSYTERSPLRNSTSAWNIGRAGGAAQFAAIDARELVIYNRALSDSEVISVVNYLAAKWSTS
jgi:hypothetical protein